MLFVLVYVAMGLNTRDEEIALEFIELNSKDVLSDASWLRLPRRYVRMILARESLNCSELDIFDAVIAWAKEEMKRESKEMPLEYDCHMLLAQSVNTYCRYPIVKWWLI